ncbi:hypothetical protein [Wenzhouxiangella sp. EGI_FJ10409]|uniref:hypothetical protein n=1 Tax=Wenzhouxiangella sp. EGI_FJ10409 TaxID=3243767 RepID=UPI0035E33E1B
MNLKTDSRKALLTGVALVGCLGFAFNAQAQTCTIDNWTGASTGVANADTGTQGGDNRRYGGPCGLRVDLDGTDRYVADDSPASESTYIARFYTFLDDAGADPVVIFAADDDTEDQIQVWYNFPNADDLTLRVFDSNGDENDATFGSVGSGWHSVEFAWEADAAAEIAFSVNGAADQTISADTSGIAIANANLGNANAANTGGTIDFDDFDSRRIERPGRLMVGDADDSGSIAGTDALAILDELAGAAMAPGQPDCNEDGSIDGLDSLCVLDLLAQ